MKTAIITGVSRGLGEALAVALLTRGFAVTGIGRLSSARLTRERCRFVRIDLANVAGIEAALTPAFRAIANARPESVCLINNAAVVEPVGVVGALDDSKVAVSLAVNLIAPFALANLFCRVFTDTRAAPGHRGLVRAAERALPARTVLRRQGRASKCWTRQLVAEQHAPTFRAISVRPGVIDTGMQASCVRSRAMCCRASSCSGAFTNRGSSSHPKSPPQKSPTSWCWARSSRDGRTTTGSFNSASHRGQRAARLEPSWQTAQALHAIIERAACAPASHVRQ